jgi:hypothetical protein
VATAGETATCGDGETTTAGEAGGEGPTPGLCAAAAPTGLSVAVLVGALAVWPPQAASRSNGAVLTIHACIAARREIRIEACEVTDATPSVRPFCGTSVAQCGARRVPPRPIQSATETLIPEVEAAARGTYDDTYLAWDVLGGLRHPELGGSPKILDIVGTNNFSFGQMEYRESGPHAVLVLDDDRIMPQYELLRLVWERYRRPMIFAKTSGLGGGPSDLAEGCDGGIAGRGGGGHGPARDLPVPGRGHA